MRRRSFKPRAQWRRSRHRNSPDSGTTRYRYDALGRQVEAKYADGRHTAIAYDTLGRLTSRIDTKGSDTFVTEYHYDSLTGSDADPDTSCMLNLNDFDPVEDLLNGRFAWVSVGNMVRYFGYDAFGYVTALVILPAPSKCRQLQEE